MVMVTINCWRFQVVSLRRYLYGLSDIDSQSCGYKVATLNLTFCAYFQDTYCTVDDSQREVFYGFQAGWARCLI